MIRLNGKKSPSITTIPRLTINTTTVSQLSRFTVRIIIHTRDANAPKIAIVIPILPNNCGETVTSDFLKMIGIHWLNNHLPGI